jgi:hypothetical protein
LAILVLAAVAAPQESAKKPAEKTPGVVVFIDPATGKIRQPDPSEIGALTAPAGPVAPRTPATQLQGPNGAVGIKLSGESLTYMVVTKTPDGKLDMDCVTGEKTANARVTTKPEVTPKGPAVVQDTHDVKAQR